MTIKKKQCLLVYLDCLPASGIDGQWGPQSARATAEAQRKLGIPDDGIWGDQTDAAVREHIYSGADLPDADEAETETTGTFWDEIEFFTPEEFRCKCGGKYCNGFPAEPHEATMRYADAIRRRIGKPITVNSGLRCPTWNSIQGGVFNSNHMGGGAVDLGKPSGVTVAEMAAAAEAVMGNTGGIGKYDWGIHIDDGTYSRWDYRT